MLSRDTRNERKLKAIRRAEFALKQRFEKIDFELDVLKPQVQELEDQAAQGALPEFTIEETS